MVQSVSFTSAAFEVFAEACLFFSICLGKKNAEVIKFLGILKKYVSENRINFCSKKKSNVSLNKKLLGSICISGNLPKLFKFFLSGKQQRVVMKGQYSNWSPVLAGASQGSTLGPLLFLIYINDLSYNLESLAKLFADDPVIFNSS